MKNAFICGYYTHQSEKKLTEYAKLIHNKTNGFDDIIDSIDQDERYFRIKDVAMNSNINLYPALIANFDSLLKEDQKVRKKCPAYNSTCVDEVKKVDSLNYIKVLELLKEYGEITEDNAGSRAIYAIGIMYWHNTMWCRNPFQPFLYKQLQKGSLDARKYAEFQHYINIENHCNFPDSANFGTSIFMIIDSILFIDCQDEATINKINKCRNEIFLDNMESMIKKTVFRYYHKNFSIGIIPMTYRDTPEEERRLAHSMKDQIDNGILTTSRYFDLRKKIR